MSDNNTDIDMVALGQEALDETIEKTSLSEGGGGYVSSAIVRNNAVIGETVPLWLITFTDIMALMLTFFVLLYSMSVPQEDKWEEIADSFSNRTSIISEGMFNSGSQDVIVIDKINTLKALNLDYLTVIINNILKSNEIKNVLLFQNNKRLIVSIPSDLLFERGSTGVSLEGKKMIFTLGEAFSRVKNRMEIIGHTDPSPIKKGGAAKYENNWELSLARSASLAALLKEAGYERDITIKGFASGRYHELSKNISQEERYNLSRRVDIIFMNDGGLRLE